MLLNLTNHPSNRWSDAQRLGAQALAGTICELGFPAVPPDSELDQVLVLARQTVDSLPDGATHALVSGEYTLTVALVGLLQQRGLVCVAACARREVVQIDAERKEQRFRFVRFREYPPVGQAPA